MPNRRNWTLDSIKAVVVVDPATGCWIWPRARTVSRYGQVTINNRRVAVHRLTFTLANGAIPKGLEVCHRCDNPPCCNPAHLFLGTHQQNMADSFAKKRSRSPMSGKPACVKGHPLSGDNLRLRMRGPYTIRICLACRQAFSRAQSAQRGL